MATPDYLEQVVVSGRRRAESSGSPSAQVGLFYRPSVTSLIWATLDVLTVVVATLIALRFRDMLPSEAHPRALAAYLIHSQEHTLLYIGWFALLLVGLARS